MTEKVDGLFGNPQSNERHVLPSKVAKNKELHQAISEKRIQDVKFLLKEYNVNPNEKLRGMSPLNMAVYSNSLDIVNALLDHHANVNEASVCADSEEGEHEYPVVTASRLCRSRSNEILDVLVSRGADVNSVDYAKLSPLYYAVHNQNFAAAQLLLKTGANVNQQLGYDNRVVLCEAVSTNNMQIVQLLVNYGAVINTADLYNGRTSSPTPLHIVTDTGMDITKYLISNGCKLNARTHTQVTPLYSALQRHQFHVAQLLLQHGADPNVTSSRVEEPTPLALAIEGGSYITAAMMVEIGCNLSRERLIAREESLHQLTMNKGLHHFLTNRFNQPMSLKTCCRLFIRHHFCKMTEDRSIVKLCELLPLPKILIQFLNLQ